MTMTNETPMPEKNMSEKHTSEKSMSFNDMNLPQALKESLTALNFITPTPIQSKTIPLALEGQDVLGSAQTGTGKTLAFALPLIAKICENPTSGGLILTPTRELAQQISNAIRAICAKNLQIKTTLVIGGDPIFKQIQNLRSAPQIIVGTPGRVIDHLERGTLNTDSLNFLILDEADRMFDMGFGVQLDRIMSELPKERQTLMFSATFPPSIEKLASKHLQSPARVSMGSVVSPIKNIKQDMVRVGEGDKYAKLLEELGTREGSVIIFVKTKMSTERLAEKLTRDNHESSAIHGDLKQQKRERVISAFRKGTTRVMVATDVVARGLDIPHIQHVINYDLPQCPEDYIHRIGRTARAGAQGSSLCLITPTDAKKWFAIQKFMDPSAKEDRSYSAGGSGGGSGGGYARRDAGKPAHRKSNSAFGGGSRFGKPGERSERTGERSFGDRPFGEKRPERTGDKPFGDRRPSERSSTDRAPRGGEGERSGERSFGDRRERSSNSERPFGDRNQSGERSFSERRPTERREPRGESRGEPRGESRGEPNGNRFQERSSERSGEKRTDNRFQDAGAPRKPANRPFKTTQRRDLDF